MGTSSSKTNARVHQEPLLQSAEQTQTDFVAKSPSEAKPFTRVHDFIKEIRKAKKSPEEVANYYLRYYTADTKFIILPKEVQALIPNVNMKSKKLLELFGIVPANAYGSGGAKEALYEFYPYKFILGTMVNSASYSNFEHRTEFAFKMYDSDGDGKISSEDLQEMLTLYSQEGQFKLEKTAIQDLVATIFLSLNKDPKVPVTYEEFREFFQTYSSKSFKVNVFDKEKARRPTVPERKFTLAKANSTVNLTGRPSMFQSLKYWSVWKNRLYIDRAKYAWLFIWFCGVVAFFVTTYLSYAAKNPAVAVAKACAAVIRYNMVIMLAVVTKSVTTILRAIGLAKVLPLDFNVFFHTVLAFVTLLASWVHSLMHLVFVFRLLASQTADELNTFINQPGRFQEAAPYSFWIRSLPSWTGIVSLVIMTVMVILAIKKMRQKNYERFWYTHAFWLALIVLLSVHGLDHILAPPLFYIYLAVPTVLLILEKLFKIFTMALKGCKMISLVYLDAEVIELKVSKPVNFKFIPGQYARINIPTLSRLQWHPFSFSSSQNEEHLSFHISPVGDWTNQLKAIAEDYKNKKILTLPKIHVMGPYGAPSQHYKDHKHVMIICSGVGATPFASIMRDLSYRAKQDAESSAMDRTIEFFWVNRKPSSQTWLNSLFAELQNDSKCLDTLKLHIYFTSPHQKYDLRSLLIWRGLEILHGQGKKVKGLEYFNLICWGRPDWEEIFRRKAHEVKEGVVGVYFCGNNMLAGELHEKCVSNSRSKVRFDFSKEIF